MTSFCERCNQISFKWNIYSPIAFFSSLTKVLHNFYPTFLGASISFVYNYKPANFKEDFISALTALVTAQNDPQRLMELNEGAMSILDNYQEELPNVLRQVKWNFSYIYAQIIYMVRYTCYRSCKPVVMWQMMEWECFLNAIGMANSMNAQIFSSLDQQIVDFAVHSIHWQWKSSCKNLCDIHITN